MVPSSPNGPCRIGKAMSISPSERATGPIGASSRLGDRELARRRGLGKVHPCSVVGDRRKLGPEREPGDHLRILERHGTVARDPDRHHLVAVGIDRAEHAAGGGAADRVLARPATEDQGHADLGRRRPSFMSSHSPCGSRLSVVRCGASSRGSRVPASTSATWLTIGISTPFSLASSRIGATEPRPSAV